MFPKITALLLTGADMLLMCFRVLHGFLNLQYSLFTVVAMLVYSVWMEKNHPSTHWALDMAGLLFVMMAADLIMWIFKSSLELASKKLYFIKLGRMFPGNTFRKPTYYEARDFVDSTVISEGYGDDDKDDKDESSLIGRPGVYMVNDKGQVVPCKR